MKLTKLYDFFVSIGPYKDAGWRRVDGPAYWVEDETFKTVVVHQILPHGADRFEGTSTTDWVATDARCGNAIAVGRDRDEAAKKGIETLRRVGAERFEKDVAKRVKHLPPCPNVLPQAKSSKVTMEMF